MSRPIWTDDEYQEAIDKSTETGLILGELRERSRIRKKLLEAISTWRDDVTLIEGKELCPNEREIGANAAIQAVLAALDRICPEERAGERSDKKAFP